MSRSYKRIRPKKHFVYTVEDLMQLFGITRNTASNWVAEGLRPSDGHKPYVFSGAEIKRFHQTRRLATTGTLRIGQFKCFKCKERIFPDLTSLELYPLKNGSGGVWARCPSCECVVQKRVNETDWDKISFCINTNTTLVSLDEGDEPDPVGLVKSKVSENDGIYFENDRIIHRWLQFAGRYDAKTISAKLAFIREFEAFFHGKSFGKIKTDDVSAFRDSLKMSVESDRDNKRSVSTVRHCASHLKAFFDWLIDQSGYLNLNRSLPGHFILPKKFDLKGLSDEEKTTPTDKEAVAMVERMPTDTIKARRDRAMISVAFLGALRVDTTTSLRVKHIDVPKRKIIQDGQVSRTKNSKSWRTKFFPLPSIFEKVVVDWLEEISVLGFRGDDALFPAEKDLRPHPSSRSAANIAVMNSIHAVSNAFNCASELVEKRFTPHSVKYYIGALGLKHCKTLQQTAAWSANMAHTDISTTQRYYQKMGQNDIDDVFEAFEQASGSDAQPDDLILMLRYHEHGLVKGTAEFERARELISEHQKKGTFA
ncbi:MAG: phage integrase N-terminal SAM-like domain-containing protein [Sulfitobacter sp.]